MKKPKYPGELISKMNARQARPSKAPEKKLKAAFKELKKNPPKVLAKTRAKKGAKQANKQRVAIAFSKAKAKK